MRRLASAWLLGAILLAPQAHGQADFSPGGRRVRPPAGARTRPGTPAPRSTDRPRTADADGATKKEADSDKLIKRYTAIVLSKPHEEFPLQKLTELYRKRDGNLDKLVEEFEKRAATPDAEQGSARIALAGIYVHAQRRDDAERLLEQAAKDDPKQAAPRLMLARLSEGKSADARRHYEAALPLVTDAAEKERVTRALMVLCIDLKDFDAARTHHQSLVRAAGGSLFVKKELGVELLNHGHFELAEKEFREIVKAAAGDNRALAPALRDLGKALARQKKMDEALGVLKRARTVAGAQAGIKNEILVLLTEVFREQGKLTELITILESEQGKEFSRLAIIGSLYEETGQVDKALTTYRQALELDRDHIDVRVKLVHLLQTAGQLQEAIREYEALIKAAPHNADFVFELAETLIQRGERDKALKLVADLETRSASEADVLAAIADFYERIEEQPRSIKVLERLSKLPASDPQYLIDLGDRHFQQGDKAKAEAAWARIKTLVPSRAKAESILGDVYLEHDMPAEALEALREAVKLAPKDKRYRKQLAVALERTATGVRTTSVRYNEALALWEELLGNAGDDELLAREARSHIVGLWAILHQLDEKLAPLTTKLNTAPPDLQAGRLLAEVQRRLHKLVDAEKTLRRVVKHAPGDEASLLALERILVMQRDLPAAIDVLEKLAEADPKKARAYFERMAQYAAELYRDDDAIRYAARAVEMSPDDAEGHYRLGSMYRRRQDSERAIQELSNAISKNDRLYKAYFDLAEMLMSSGKVEDADRLYRKVVRTARDEDFVMRAARLSMQVNLGKGTLESLERELLPVALGNPQKPMYRRLLVELYGVMTFPLVNAARMGTPEAAKRAREDLAKIGARAVKPLLDALADDKHAQQRVAIEVLAYVENKGAGPALFNFALGPADRELRVRAMVACGALSDPELLSRYEELLSPSDGEVAPGDAIAVTAAWGVARMNDKKAEALLARLIATPGLGPELRALGAVGLGLRRNPRYAELLAVQARSSEADSMARAAAAFALGELGDKAHRSLLVALTDSSEQEVKLAALAALARLYASGHRGGPSTTELDDIGPILARGMLSDELELRRASLAAAAAVVTGSYRHDGPTLPVPDGVVALADVLRSLSPRGYRRDEQARAVVELRAHLAKAALAAVATSPARARVVAQLVTADLTPLLDSAAPALDSTLEGALAQTRDAILEATLTSFVALTRHPSLEVRKSAIELLARRPEKEAQQALVQALDDDDAEVSKTALSSITSAEAPATQDAILALLASSPSWSIRVHASAALGRVTRTAGGERIDAALAAAARGDPFAMVREAALRGLVARRAPDASRVLAEVGRKDGEPRVRELARRLSRGASP